eukprot:4697155-Lingulodinium_polyedra.AAC.1
MRTHDGPQGQRGAAGRLAHCCHGGFGEREGKQDMERHFAMMWPGTRWHMMGRKSGRRRPRAWFWSWRAESSWAEKGAQRRGQSSVTH